MQFKMAEQFGQLMRQYPAAIPTAYSSDYGNDWTHLILTYVIQVLQLLLQIASPILNRRMMPLRNYACLYM